MKLDILVFGSHPDDAELGAGATIAKEIANGKKVGIVDLTRGELGTRGSADTRAEEAAASAKILGLSARENLGFADGFFVNDKDHQLRVIRMLRKYRPDVVLCNAIEDRHIDHGRGSNLVSDACFLSGLVKIETESHRRQEPWRPRAVYHYIQWKNLKPDFVVDVSGYIEKKAEAILAYSSQFHDPKSKEPDTPISSKNFLDSVKYRARDLGRLVGVEYGEGFTVERLIAVERLGDLI
jgi:bacillithiol biosynthesis deacetylase BshB1